VPDEQRPDVPDGQDLQAALLAAVEDGAVLIGTPATLASGFGVSVTGLRVALRGLLEARRIAVNADDRGHLTLRLERRRSVAGVGNRAATTEACLLAPRTSSARV